MPEVLLEIEEGVATLVLNAPERRNALTTAMAREVIAACEAIDADDTVGAVVVAGEGDAFCAGGDRAALRAVGAAPEDPAVIAELRTIYDAFVRVGSLRAPSIAAVHGAAVGAGLNLVLATDLRIVAEDARLLGGFQRIGLHPGGGNITLLARLVGREAAIAMTAFGEEIDGAGAVRLGLAWDAVPAAEVRSRATALARRAAADPVLSRDVVGSARAELGPPGLSWSDALELELAPQLRSLSRALSAGTLG